MRLLPQTNRTALRIAILAICLVYLTNALFCILFGFKGHWVYGGMGVFFWLPLSLGLWYLKNVARVVALVLHWFLFVMLPFGILSPETAMNPAWARTPLWVLFGYVITLGTLNCLAIHTLTRSKDQFKPLSRESA